MTPPIKVTSIPDEARAALLAMLQMAEREDEFIRLAHLKKFKRNNLFWHGFQYLFWNQTDQDWRIPTHEQLADLGSREEVDFTYRYVINIFKAHGESIIAALSADIPDVQFGPRDADDPSDRRAVDAADNCVELIQRWNRAKLLIINALFYLATEGFVAAYNYNKKDEAFGMINIPQYDTRLEPAGPDMAVCDECGYQEPAQDPETQQIVHSANEPCPQCGQPLQIQPGTEENIPFMAGEKPTPKGREIVEIYGALNVRVPSYVIKQADAGYLILYVDAHVALFKDAFPDVEEEISADSGQSYERLMRQSSLSMEGYQASNNLTTQKRVWFKSWYLRGLESRHDTGVKWLQKKCPSGIYASFIGDIICELRDERDDKHWTITKSGPSKGIHADPLLESLVPVQELTNNLENMMVMSVEYGIPASYADTEVYDFDGMSKQEVSPGFRYPISVPPGHSAAEYFYTEPQTNLSKEAVNLKNSLSQDAQFVSGSQSSIYGGPQDSGSKTLGEYEKSRNFALQRLSIVWYFINVWWGETMHKALQSFIEHQVEDEPLTSQNAQNGLFQTKWIRQADLKGSFDRLEPEVSSDFPVSFAAKRSTLMALLQLNNETINSVLTSPENAHIVQQYAGLRELKIPDEIQRNKQIQEILVLVGMEPQDNGEQAQASVPIEPDVDDNQVHIDTLINFLASDTGQDLKRYNPGGYANCLAHLQEHKQAMLPPPGMMPPPGAPMHPPAAGMPGSGMPPPGKPPAKPQELTQ